MVRHGIRSRKNSASLTVHTLAVAEEQTRTCRIMLIEDTTLTHEAFVDQRRIQYLYAGADNEIHTLHTRTEFGRRLFIGVYRSVLETAGTHDTSIVADTYVLDTAAIDDMNVLTYLTHIALHRCRVGVDGAVERLN